MVYRPRRSCCSPSTPGAALSAEADELLAETRKGRGGDDHQAGRRSWRWCAKSRPSTITSPWCGDNRKLVMFTLEELPVMTRGQGVHLQRYRDGGLSDAITLKLDEGLSWQMGGSGERTRTETDMRMWKVARGAAGRMPPQGFPKSGRFD